MRTCVISITGFSPDSSPSRETLKSAIDAVGACYLGPLCRGVTTHLLCRCASGAKVEAAAQWGEVPLLRAEWVLTSLREGKRAEEGDFPVEREEDLISTGDEEEVSLRDDGDDDGDEVKGDGNGSDGGNEVHGERNGNGDGGDDDGNCDDDDIESDHSVVLNNPANNGPVVPENHDSTMDDRIDMVDDHHVNTTSDNDRVNTNNETIHPHPNTTSDFIKEEDHIDPVNEDNPIQSINENNPVNEDNPINLVNENNPVNEDNPIQSINENNPINPIDENTHTNTTHDQHDHSNTINENNDQHDHTHTSTDTISSTRRSEKRPTLPHVFLLSGDVPPDAPTIIDMSSHVYLNLNGFKNRDVMNEYLKVNASYYLEKDATGTPTGNFIPVEGSVFDLRTPKLLEELSQGAVYNPIMALDGEGGTLREVAEVSIPEQGRSYTLHTTARALQVYNAYNMASFYTSRGLESPFAPAPGLAIEPQNYPNAINIPSMPSPILRPGETYSERQFFAFKW